MSNNYFRILFLSFIFTGCNSGIINSIIQSFSFKNQRTFDDNPDVNSPTLDMIRRAGYPAEAHIVKTEDDYLLTLHRIPGKIGARVIFLQHGLLGSSADWIIPGPEKSLAYLLFDRGYDVWLGNARGNTYSRAHTNLSPSDSQFWDFSFHEMGIYDLPAVINYITNMTGDDLIYVGHSMGTTMGYIFGSERPDIADKVKLMISLAPIAIMKHIKSPLRLIAPYARDIEFITRFLGVGEFLPQNILIKILATYGCNLLTIEEEICGNILFAICGYDADQFNKTLLPVILSHDPAGSSTKTIIHFAQEINSGHFRQYDYGTQKNMEVYHTPYPPDYDISEIRIPIALFYSLNDWLAAPQDIETFSKKLPDMVDLHKINYTTFNHLDFLWAVNVRTLLYNEIIALIDKYQD